MKELQQKRPARTPVEEGISLLPYIPLYQRAHRRQWGMALLTAAALGAVWLLRRR